MKNLKKKLAKKAGFTLVELIVVIAILAILAAVAVPAYTGYIQKAQESKVYSSLDALKTAVVFTATEKATGHVVTVEAITVEYSSTENKITVKATTDPANVDVSGYTALFTNGDDLAKAMKDANVTTAKWTADGASWTLAK